MTSGITSSTITDGQRQQFFRLLEDAGKKATSAAKLDRNSLQQLIENGGELQARIISAVKELSRKRQSINKEVMSVYGYYSGYKPKGVVEQMNILHQPLPSIGYANQDLLTQMIEKDGAELPSLSKRIPEEDRAWFAIPHWSMVGNTYQAAVEKVLELLEKTYRGHFINCCKDKLSQYHLRETPKKAHYMKVLQQDQQANILFVPAQFGIRHRGRSIHLARAMMSSGEFGLGVYEISIMLLTHPERLQDSNDLWIACSGDEFSPNADGSFKNSPIFKFEDDKLKLYTYWVGTTGERCGSASAFMPSLQ